MDEEWLIEHQDRVAARSQLAAAGVTRHHVRRRVESGRWQVVGRVVVLHNGPISERQRRWIATLSQPSAAALTGLSALSLSGLRGWSAPMVHVTIPHGWRPWRAEWLTVTTSRTTRATRQLHQEPPSVVPAEAALDAAALLTVRRACALLAAVVQQRLATPEALVRAVTARSHLPRRSAFLAHLADLAGGAQSLGEADFLRLALRAGLRKDRIVRQAVRRDADGRRRYLDVDFGTFVVEVDGGVHWRAETYANDLDRHNAVVVGTDRPLLRFSTLTIRLDPESVIRRLRQAVDRWG